MYNSISIEYPSEKNPIVCYFEESGDDLKYLYCTFLKKAKKSIFISSFGITDSDIHRILKKKAKDGVEIIYHNSKEQKKLRKKTSGLYHKKILIIDKKELFIGSANCSVSSLSLHGNQIFGFFDKNFIRAILENRSFQKEGLEFYSLPKDKLVAFNQLKGVLQNAKKTIKISMYALTHKILIEEIIHAQKRGVNVKLYLDSKMINGSISKYVKILKQAGIPISLRAKGGLNHHKCALIDDTYVFGSANWSNAGFKKNEETLILLTLTEKKLKQQIDNFFKNLDFYSVDF